MVTREMLGATKGTSDADSWVLIHGPVAEHVTRRFVLSIDRDSFTIGRSTQSQIVVDSGAASRQHARLSRVPGGWWIQDLGSLNGTYVNDVRVERGTIAHGDRVQIGDVFFKHLSGSDVEASFAEAIRAALVTDGLTQAANERAFREALREVLVRDAAPEGDALVIADLDHFKSVNDTHGHPAGDRVLREFVRIVRAACGDSLFVARIGGEEFALLMRGVPVETARSTAERARVAVESHAFAIPTGTLALTASFGVTMRRRDDDDGRWFARADAFLYEAKRAGRNRVAGD